MGQKPTQPSLVTSKKTDESEEMAAQSTSLKCKDPPRFIDFKITGINWRGFDPQHELYIFDHAKNFDLCFVPDAIKRLSTRWSEP